MLNDVMTEKEVLITNAKELVSTYWDWFNEQNTVIANNRKVGITDMQVSNIAPVVESRKSGDSASYYIVWKNHSRIFRKNMKKKKGCNASLPIHSYTSKSITNILKTKCTWDLTRALDYENKFVAIRTAIKGMHEAEVRLRSSYRKLQSIKLVTESP
jgi:hypothetical protein